MSKKKEMEKDRQINVSVAPEIAEMLGRLIDTEKAIAREGGEKISRKIAFARIVKRDYARVIGE